MPWPGKRGGALRTFVLMNATPRKVTCAKNFFGTSGGGVQGAGVYLEKKATFKVEKLKKYPTTLYIRRLVNFRPSPFFCANNPLSRINDSPAYTRYRL